MATMVSTRVFGEARVSVVATGSCYVQPRFRDGQEWRTPADIVNADGLALHGINSLVIETPGRVSVVDPCSFAPDETTLGGGSVLTPGPTFEESLDALGVDPADVDVVIVTHGHDDHYVGLLNGALLRFPNAEVFFPKPDWEDIQRGEMYNSGVGAQILAPVEASGKLTLVSGDRELDDELAILHTPGETRGHQVICLDVGRERLYYLGDLFHYPIEFEQLQWASGDKSSSALADFERSRMRVLTESASAASTLVFTHGVFPAWGVADRQGTNSWVWRYA
jgi:glyoxylase-like metal-dependent hydrolase (beta-lactamase superfamily II)